jgi:predicted outer membrane repeat protein
MTKLANFVFHSSLAIAIIFNVIAVGRAKAEDVNNFEGLQAAINSEKTEIAIKNTIYFIANGPVINYNNIVISGPSENAPGLLDGRNNHKLLTFGESAKNISLKNLHLSNGNKNDVPSILNGGGAIHLNAGVVVSLEGLTFSNSQTRSLGGAIYSWGTDNNNRNSLNFTGKTIFDGNKTIGDDKKGGAIFAVDSTLIFERGLATFKNNSSTGGGGAIYAEDSSLTFGKLLATFENNSSTRGGGAIYGGNGTKLTFGGEVIFTENSSASNGGAIYSSGENSTN